MGLFDIFKKKKSVSADPNIQTIYFENGKLYKVQGKDEHNWYDADILVSDGISYNLNNTREIKSIPIPNFGITDSLSGYGATGMLDYVLRMKAGCCFNKNEKWLCSALLWKSTELMFANKYCNWRDRDYKRLIDWHIQMGMHEEAEKARDYLNKKGISFVSPNQFANDSKLTTKKRKIPQKKNYAEYEKKYIQKAINNQQRAFDSTASSIKSSVIGNSKRFHCDLVAFHDYGTGCCSECSSKTGRVYSISGTSKIFPPLPEYVKKHGNFHPGCRCTMSAYFDDDTIYYKGERVSAIKASKRPWSDNRTEQEKMCYQEYVDKITTDAKREAAKDWDRNEYDILLEKLPDDAPKSFSSYRRMKSGNTSGFQKLQEKAAKIGIEI